MKTLFLILAIAAVSFLKAQQSINAAGGNGTGAGGSFSYSIGQIDYTTVFGSNGSAAMGVQHPEEKILVNVKVFTSNVNSVSGLMSTNLIAIDPMSAVPFPTADPYFSGIYATSGNYAHVPNVITPPTSTTILSTNNIVDWIFVELRTGTSGATSVAFAKAALLRNDGIILNSDGTPLSFAGASTSTPYFVAIKHRNHIGFMTLASQTYPNSLLNLTNNLSIIYGSNALRLLSAGKYVMWAGDGNVSGDVDPFDLAAMYPLNGNIIDEYNPWDMDLDTNVDNPDLLLVYPNNGNIIQQID
jgi:hypothetical protein